MKEPISFSKKGEVNYSDHASSVDANLSISATAELISTKRNKKQDINIFNQECGFSGRSGKPDGRRSL